MVEIIAGLCPSGSNHLLLKMKIMKTLTLNRHPLSNQVLFLVILVRVTLEGFVKYFMETFRETQLEFIGSLFGT